MDNNISTFNERLITVLFGFFIYALSITIFEKFVKSNNTTVKQTIRLLNPLQQSVINSANANNPVVLSPYQTYIYKQSLYSFKLQRIKMKLLKVSMMMFWTMAFRSFGLQYIFNLLFPNIESLFLPGLKEIYIYQSFIEFTFGNIELYIAFIMVVMLGRIKDYKIRKTLYSEVVLILIGSLCFEYIHKGFIKGLDEAHWISRIIKISIQTLPSDENHGLLPLKLLFPLSVTLWVYYTLFTENWKLEFFFQVFLYSVTLETLKYIFNWLQPGWGTNFIAPIITFLIII